jgi:hypothetical protein
MTIGADLGIGRRVTSARTPSRRDARARYGYGLASPMPQWRRARRVDQLAGVALVRYSRVRVHAFTSSHPASVKAAKCAIVLVVVAIKLLRKPSCPCMQGFLEPPGSRGRGLGVTLIRSVHALLYTGIEEDAGTDGNVYLGAGGREFRLDAQQNDFARGGQFTYRFGTFPTVVNAATNDPLQQLIRLEDVDALPLYIRFEPRSGDDRWKLRRAVVVFNNELSPMWDSNINAPDGIWLDHRSGLILHLPRVAEARPQVPSTPAELEVLLLAEESARPAPRTSDLAESDVRLVESLGSYIPWLEERPDDQVVEPLEPAGLPKCSRK